MSQARGRNAGLIMRGARIWSGLLLLFFVTSHLLNLSLGMISIEAMDAARPYLTGIWSSPVMGPVLLASLTVHYFLGLWTIYRRPTLRTNTQDLVQLFSGVLVVPLLATHAVGTAVLGMNEIPFGYRTAIPFFWLAQPAMGLLQVVLLSVVWVHGCAGLFTWLRSKEGMRHMLGWLYPVAVAIPVMALLGFAEAGRGVLIEARAAETATYQSYSSTGSEAESQQYETAERPAKGENPLAATKEIVNLVIWWSLGLAALTFVGRAVRLKVLPYEKVSLRRGEAEPVSSTSRLSVLESFRQNDQPHAGLCEGRGRCGTCAVRILSSEFPLPEASALELKTLRRIGAGEDARLACQLTPTGGFVTMEPLYPADYSFKDEDYAEPELGPDQTEVRA